MNRLFTTFLFFMMLLQAHAQLQLRGTIYSEGPVQVSLSIETYDETHFLHLQPDGKIEFEDREVDRTKYELPWEIVKDYNHTIKITDGTVEKIIFVEGTVPDDLTPREKFVIDIDLINPKTADRMLVVFWSLPDNQYMALPYSRLDEIRRRCVDPSVWDQ